MIMNKRVTDFAKKSIVMGILIFVIRLLFSPPESFYDFIGITGEVVSITMALMGIYCSLLWKFNPLEKTPKIMGSYEGVIEYNFNGEFEKKDATVIIKQNLLSTKVQIVTNEIISNTITSDLIVENNQHVLYYTYITNPKSKYSKENPMQYGTCRLLINAKNKFTGNYWTSRQTIGDLELSKTGKKRWKQ